MRLRVNSIDILRGIIMIIMALDHTRDYFHYSTFVFDPTDLDRTTPWIFGTRWITHFCAPAFALLSGVSIYINSLKKTRTELTKYLLTRGLWLVFLDLVVLRFAFFFNFYYDMTFFSILWMLGWCMVLMSPVLYMPRRAALVVSIIIIVGHDALLGLSPPAGASGFAISTILFGAGFIPPAFVSTYPIVPWLGIMMFGYCIGAMYSSGYPASIRQKTLTQTGVLFVTLFVVLRALNIYGDPVPWDTSRAFPMNVISFFNVSKYPVSVSFMLMTLGPILIALALLERTKSTWAEIVSVYGRVPLFYFLIHFFVIHAAALVQRMIATGKSFSEIDLHFDKGFGGITPEGGVTLLWVYVAWVVIVVSMYPVCRWYGSKRDKYTILTYL